MKRHINDAILFPWPSRESFLIEIALSIQIEEWCKATLIGPFTVADMGVYIYKKSDAALYRLRWNNA